MGREEKMGDSTGLGPFSLSGEPGLKAAVRPNARLICRPIYVPHKWVTY